MRRRVFIALGILAVGILIFSGVLERGRGLATYGVGRFVGAPVSLIRNIFTRANSDVRALQRKNEELQAEIVRLKSDPVRIKIDSRQALTAKVFSTYPFNNHSLVALNVGSRQGVRVFSPVIAGEHFLFGQVIEVSAQQSIVRTVFDPDWKLAVKAGEKGQDALFSGGRAPRLELIPKDGEVEVGDSVYSTGKDIPYGLMIGKVMGVKESSDRAFREAEVKIPFSLPDVREVHILEFP